MLTVKRENHTPLAKNSWSIFCQPCLMASTISTRVARRIYLLLVIFRFLSVLFPGYIHPDEFFQSPELSASDIFGIDGIRTWEWDISRPVRSWISLVSTSGASFWILQKVSILIGFGPKIPSVLLYCPRIWAALMSFVTDYATWKVGNFLFSNGWTRLLTLASSWPLWIIGTRPFSNSTETFLFSFALLLVLPKQEKSVQGKLNESVQGKGDEAEETEYVQGKGFVISENNMLGINCTSPYKGEPCDPVKDSPTGDKNWEYIKNNRLASEIEGNGQPEKPSEGYSSLNMAYRRCFWCGIIGGFGFFVRPTFLLYMCPLSIFALYQTFQIKNKEANLLSFTTSETSDSSSEANIVNFDRLNKSGFDKKKGERELQSEDEMLKETVCDWIGVSFVKMGGDILVGVVAGGFGFICSVSIMALADRIYFGKWVLTPINLIAYNSKKENLALHGLHPHYLHLLVNFPLLFGPLAVSTWVFLIGHIFPALNRQKHRESDTCPRKDRQKVSIMSAIGWSIAIPLMGLSFAPHQEPRFLLPLILPLVILFGEIPWQSKRMTVLWITFNSLSTVFFGTFHQAGVTPSISFLHYHLQNLETLHPFLPKLWSQDIIGRKNINSEMFFQVDLVFYMTYKPPIHLFAFESKKKTKSNASGMGFNISVIDLGGGSIDELSSVLFPCKSESLGSSSFCNENIVSRTNHTNTNIRADNSVFHGKKIYNLKILITPGTTLWKLPTPTFGTCEDKLDLNVNSCRIDDCNRVDIDTPRTFFNFSRYFSKTRGLELGNRCSKTVKFRSKTLKFELVRTFFPHLTTEGLDDIIQLTSHEGLRGLRASLGLNVYLVAWDGCEFVEFT